MVQNIHFTLQVRKGTYLVKRLWSLTVQTFRYADVSFKQEPKKSKMFGNVLHTTGYLVKSVSVIYEF